MDTNRHSTIRPIERRILLVALLVAVISLAGMADQLQWNDATTSLRAVQALVQNSWVISYCSLADTDTVGVWLIRGICVADTSAEGLLESKVLAKCVYQSHEDVAADEFPLSEDRWTFEQVNDSNWGYTGIDLAYTYIYTGDSSFRCLGKALDLDCQVEVETISLPDQLIEALQRRSSLELESPLPWFYL